MTEKPGCRSCTETRECASCRRRRPSMPPDSMNSMITATDLITQTTAAAYDTGASSSCDSSSSSSSDTGGTGCGGDF